MKGWELRERRHKAELTLAQVARAAGTSESNVSAYERGAKAMNHRTLQRLTAAIEAGGASIVHQRQLVTVPAAAAAIRKGLRAGWSRADLVRVIRELRSNAASITAPTDRAAFFAEPSTTGDARWDAFLAGVVEDLALRGQWPPPAWSAGHGLNEFWFVGGESNLQAYAFARSPISLHIRGVVVDPDDLESV